MAMRSVSSRALGGRHVAVGMLLLPAITMCLSCSKPSQLPTGVATAPGEERIAPAKRAYVVIEAATAKPTLSGPIGIPYQKWAKKICTATSIARWTLTKAPDDHAVYTIAVPIGYLRPQFRSGEGVLVVRAVGHWRSVATMGESEGEALAEGTVTIGGSQHQIKPTPSGQGTGWDGIVGLIPNSRGPVVLSHVHQAVPRHELRFYHVGRAIEADLYVRQDGGQAKLLGTITGLHQYDDVMHIGLVPPF